MDLRGLEEGMEEQLPLYRFPKGRAGNFFFFSGLC